MKQHAIFAYSHHNNFTVQYLFERAKTFNFQQEEFRVTVNESADFGIGNVQLIHR